jgi:hypothetical protein
MTTAVAGRQEDKSMKKLIGIAAATALAAAIAAPAAAAPSNKGATDIRPSDITTSVFVQVLKPSTGLSFGIVGNPAKGPIKHVGGIAIDTTAFPDGVNDSFLQLRNFWIDVPAGEVTGLVEGIGRAPLFDFGNNAAENCVSGEVELVFTEEASAVITGSPTAIEGAWAACATVNLNEDFPPRGGRAR